MTPPTTREAFRAAREQIGYTRQELAGALECSIQSIVAWEKGTRPINRITALALAYLVHDHRRLAPRRARRPKTVKAANWLG